MTINKTYSKISLCGLDCASCAAFVARETDNDELRKQTAQDWTKKYRSTGRNRPPVKPEDINCLGCLSLVEPLYIHCKECGVRNCGLKKGIKNCGKCDEYKSCDKIVNLHKLVFEGKKLCDKINQKTK